MTMATAQQLGRSMPSADSSPIPILRAECLQRCAPDALAAVGQGLSDSEREKRIRDLATLMETAIARYARSSNFADRGEADRYRLEMEALMAGRNHRAAIA